MGRNLFSKHGRTAMALPITTGKVFFVHASGTANYDELQSWMVPDEDGVVRVYTTVDSAINASTASQGDIIYVLPGHTETFTAAAGFALDVAGVSVIGLGSGNARPAFTISSTDNTGTITQSGNNTVIKNIVVITNDDALTNAVVVSGNNCVTEFEHQDTSSAVEAATAVRGDTADNWTLKLKHNGFTAGNATVSVVRLDDCDNVDITIDAYGVWTTAGVEMVDVASTNVRVNGYMYCSGVTNGSRDVVDTITASTWFATIEDGAAGAKYSGGSAAALAADDISSISSTLLVPTADSTANTDVADVVGNKTDAAIADTIEGAAATTQSVLADVKAILQRVGADSANNTASTALVADNRDGSVLERLETVIATLRDDVATNFIGVNDADNVASSSSVVANVDGSLLERDEALQVASAPSKNHPNYFTVTADMTSATWNTVAAHEIATVTGMVRMQIIVEVTATVITTGTNGTIALGYEGNTSAIFSATALDAALTGDLFSAVYGSAATTVASGAEAQSSLTHAIFDVVVATGKDVGYTIATNAATTGTLTFHVYWQPLDSTGAVTAGAGGAL